MRRWWALALAPLAGCTRPPAPPAPPPPALVLTDAARASGLDYTWKAPHAGPLNALETIGHGCALLDFDGDGNLDALLVGPQPALYRGDGTGKFADVSVKLGGVSGRFLGVAVGDVDNDGDPDVYLSGYREGRLLRNEGGKTFTDSTAASGLKAQPWGTSAAFADVDGDGKLDLFVANYLRFGKDGALELCTHGNLKTACGPRWYKPEFGTLWRNAGGGRFAPVALPNTALSGKGLGVASVDPEGAGRSSLYIANDEMPGDLLQPAPRGALSFTNGADAAGIALDRDGHPHGGMGVDWGDYDNDGSLDLVVGTFNQEDKNVYHSEGGGLYEDRSHSLGMAPLTPLSTFGVKWCDFDNDGWLDLLAANGHVQDNIAQIDPAQTYRQSTVLLRSDAGKRFAAVRLPDLERPVLGRGLAVGDIDNDGGMDALLVDSEGAPLLLRNGSAGRGHWLSVRLVGTRSNRDGYGAQVRVSASGRTLVRHCHSDGSYLSASDPRVHVGLGAAASVDWVEIRWPSGRTERWSGLAIDKLHTLKEGDGKP